MSYNNDTHRSLGKRSQPGLGPTNSNEPNGKYNGRKRDMKDRDTNATDVSGTGGNVVEDGAFSKFPEIHEKTVNVLISKGYKYLFPIQRFCFQPIYNREDLIARDLTGSGKTFAFGLPLVEWLRNKKLLGTGKVQAIILAPTRELALQITAELTKLKHSPEEFKIVTVYGGVSVMDQANQLKRGVDLFVGTTGRVKDHIERGNIDFSEMKSLVLDEADVMLKLGFKEDVDHILEQARQTCDKENLQIALFSATIPDWIKDIARQHMKSNYKVVDLCKDLTNKTARNVRHLAIECPWHDRLDALTKVLNCYGGTGRIICFSSTKADANSVLLSDKITHDVEVMHGDIAQNQREVTIKRFKDGKFQVLVATDVASRGLDIPNVELVIQLEPPKDTESYIHRSGRTARAGKTGMCITFFTRKNEEFVDRIEQLAGIKLERVPIPSEEDMLKAKNKDVLKKLKDVDHDVLENFTETAEILLEDCENDPIKALKICLAYCSGNYKTTLPSKSLLNGRDGFITIKMSVEEGNQLEESLAQEIIQRYWSPRIASQVRNMTAIADGSGVCFDLRSDQADSFFDNYDHLKATQGRKVDFDCQRAKTLPKMNGQAGGSSYSRGGGGNGYGGGPGGGGYQGGGRRDGGDRGGNRGGFGGGGDRSYGNRRDDGDDNGFNDNGAGASNAGGGDWQGGTGWSKDMTSASAIDGLPRKQSRFNNFNDQPKKTDFNGFSSGASSYYQGASTAYSRNSEDRGASCNKENAPLSDILYMGNLSYGANEMELMQFINEFGFKPLRAKLNLDKETGKSKGCAFVQMSNETEAAQALKALNGKGFLGRELAVRYKTANHAGGPTNYNGATPGQQVC